MKRLLTTTFIFYFLSFSLSISDLHASVIKSSLGNKSISLIHDEKSPLPEGVVAVEYIETTANDQYIDIKYVPTSWKEIISMTYVRTSDYTAQGGKNGSPYMFFQLYSGNGCVVTYGNKRYNVWNSSLHGINEHVTVTFGNGKVSALNSDRGVKIEEEAAQFDFSQNTKSLWILNCNSSSFFATPLGLRFYSCIIIDANGEIVRDIIPVKANGIGCAFDKVSQQLFFNSGSGSFITGPDL